MSDQKPCSICGEISIGTAGFDHWTEEQRIPCCESCGAAEKFIPWCEMAIKVLDECQIGFESRSNLADDYKEAKRCMLVEERMKDGVCPNGCARMVRYEDGDDHTRTCPVCKFVGWQNTQIDFPYESPTPTDAASGDSPS